MTTGVLRVRARPLGNTSPQGDCLDAFPKAVFSLAPIYSLKSYRHCHPLTPSSHRPRSGSFSKILVQRANAGVINPWLSTLALCSHAHGTRPNQAPGPVAPPRPVASKCAAPTLVAPNPSTRAIAARAFRGYGPRVACTMRGFVRGM